MRRSKALAPQCRETLLVISVLISADSFFFLFLFLFIYLFIYLFIFFFGGEGGGGWYSLLGNCLRVFATSQKHKGFHVNLNDKWKRRKDNFQELTQLSPRPH